MPALAAVALTLALSASPSLAQNPSLSKLPFPEYMQGKPSVAPPYISTDRVPVIRDGVTKYVPGDKIVTPDSTQTITNKTLDYNENTFLNFPFSGGVGGPLPTSCSGLEDGSLYNNNGTVGICTSATLTWDDGSTVTFDDGTPVAGF